MSRGSSTAWRKMRQHILRRDQHTCAYCGEDADEVDHVIPVAHGGTDDEWNLVAACRKCNLRKSDSTLPFFDAQNTPRRLFSNLPPRSETLRIDPETPFKRL